MVADLPLPRERPDLHVTGNLKEQGPGPEVVYISPQIDTLAVTLDLYGAVGMLRWSAAKEGKLAKDDWVMVSTADSPQLTGRSFPDRATPISLGSREYYLVCNAGEDGGSVLVDLQQRKVVWRRSTPPGLEAPVYIPELRQAFSVCSGKTKRRQGSDIVKSSNPQKSLFIFDFHSREAVQTTAVTTVPLDGFTTQIALASAAPPLLVVAIGAEPDHADTLVTIDPDAANRQRPACSRWRHPAIRSIGGAAASASSRESSRCTKRNVMMFETVEMRWFFHDCPLDSACHFHLHTELQERTDWYSMPCNPLCGIKVREGKLEAKLRAATLGVRTFSPLVGHLEAWRKWSLEFAADDHPAEADLQTVNWLAVNKRRQLRRFEVSDAARPADDNSA